MKLSGLIEPGIKELGPRFLLVGLMPSTVLLLFGLALLWSGAPAQAPDLGAVQRQLADAQANDWIQLVLAILVFALIMQPLQLSMVRLLEGYWGDSRLARRLTALGVDQHRRMRERLEKDSAIALGEDQALPSPEVTARAASAAWELRLAYPAQDRLLPTGLGNVLRAAEDLAGRRYGLDAVVMWPRLYPLLPDKTSALVADMRNQLDLAVRFCVVFCLAALLSLFVLLPHGLWLLVPIGALGLAWLSYRAAIAAAIGYGQTVHAAFDLHRFELWKAMHLPLPADRDAERKAARDLCAFLMQGKPVNLKYDHGAPKQPPPAS